MDSEDSPGVGHRPSRRRVLGALGGAGAVALAGCLGSGGTSGGTEAEEEGVTIGLTTPETGPYSPIGDHERDGFDLAIEHLNNGGGLIGKERFSNLDGNGILGQEVETRVIDTESNASVTESRITGPVGNDEITMFTGGVSGNVVRVNRDVATESGVPYFVGSTTMNEFTGSNCSRHVYRELFNSSTLARALVPEIAEELEGTQTFYQVYVNAPEGRGLKDTINRYTTLSDFDWRSFGNTSVSLGSTDFSSELQSAATSNVDIVFLDLFGLDAVNAIRQSREAFSEDTIVVAPLLTQSVADSLGEQVDGVYGTVGWHERLDTPLSEDFSDAYQRSYGGTVGTTSLVPPGPAQNIYGQVLLYASAVEAAGTFEHEAVRSTLEGFEYALGAGRETMRACDHQAIRPVPVVQGRAETDTVGNYFQLLGGRRGLEPSCEEPPAADCEL